MKIDLRQFLLAASVPVVVAGSPGASAQDDSSNNATGLVAEVRQAADRFRDPSVAMDEGYAPILGCVSAPQEGAMGLHLGNESLIGDGTLNAAQPELLVYEPREDGRLRLVAVEFIVIAETWDAANPAPPVLEGQLFHYVGSPNRYGLPAFYELHVWAWKHNPHGMFVDFNPRVTCKHYAPDE